MEDVVLLISAIGTLLVSVGALAVAIGVYQFVVRVGAAVEKFTEQK